MAEYTKTQIAKMNLGALVQEMINIKSDRLRAQSFFDAFVDSVRDNVPGLTYVGGVFRASADLGYLMGYAPDSIDVKMWGEVGAVHPIFGNEVLAADTEEGRKQ